MKKVFMLHGLGCANCAAKMQEGVEKLDGVKRVIVNFATAKLTIEGEDDKMEKIIESTKSLIKKIEPDVVLQKA